MVKILINNVSILTLSLNREPLIEHGYVYLSNGKVAAIGKGEPPDELRYPELLINGRGRILSPGLSALLTSVTLYPFRYRINELTWDNVKGFLSVLTRTDVYYLACMVFMDMVLRGVTSALVTDIYLDSVARAAHDVGIYVTLAVPIGCGIDEFDPIRELRLLNGRWGDRVEGVKPALLIKGPCTEGIVDELSSVYEGLGKLRAYVLNPSPECNDLRDKVGLKLVYVNPTFNPPNDVGIIRIGEGIKSWRPGEGLGLGVRPSYNMLNVVRHASMLSGTHIIDALHDAVVVNPKLMGYESLGCIDTGRVANVVMYDTSEPPGWPPPTTISDVVSAIVNGELRVETVILSDNVLVDAGETLNTGMEIVRKARDRFENELIKYLKNPAKSS